MGMLEKGEYRAAYKCRLCGKEFEAGTICTIKLNIVRYSTALTSQETVYPGDGGIGVSRLDTHFCDNGDVEMADFIGFKKERTEHE